MPSPALQRLSRALRAATCGGDPQRVVAFALRCGVDGRLGRRAAAGMDVNASAHLKLCAGLGIDPLTGEEVIMGALPIPDLDWHRVGVKVLLELIGTPDKPHHLPMRQAAEEWGLSLVTLARMKAAHPVNIDNLLTLCRALRCHPHDFLRRTPEKFAVKHQVEHVENARWGT